MASVGTLVDASGNSVYSDSNTAVPAGTNWTGIFNSLTQLGGSIASAVSGQPATISTGLSPTQTTAQPYPVTQGGVVIGYSAVPQPQNNSSSMIGLLLIGFGLLAVIFIASPSRRR